MKIYECAPAYACAVIQEIIKDNPARVALDLIESFISGDVTVGEVIDV